MDSLHEAECHLFYTQLKRNNLESKEHINFMAKIFQMPPEKLYRLMTEGPTLEEQRIQEEARRAIDNFNKQGRAEPMYPEEG